MTSFQFPTEGISYTKAEKKIINYIYQHPSAVILCPYSSCPKRWGFRNLPSPVFPATPDTRISKR